MMDHRRAECWSDGVTEYCRVRLLQNSNTPLVHHPGAPRFSHFSAIRLAGRLLIGIALLAVTMTGCGPSSDKGGQQAATNAAAPRTLAKTNTAVGARPGVIT